MDLNPFAKKADLRIGTDRTVYRPGEVIATRVAVATDRDLAIEEGRVELVLSNRYTYRTSSGKNQSSDVTTTDEAVVERRRFLDAGTIAAGAATERAVPIQIPRYAAATGSGALTTVAWLVRAVLNVKRATDPNAVMPITIVAPREVHAGRAEVRPEGTIPVPAEIAFGVPSRSVRTGESLAGTLRIVPREAVDAAEVRIELVRREEVTRDKGLRRDVVVDSRAYSGPLDFAPDQPHDFAFSLPVPSDACPILATEHTSVRWFLRGVVNRRLRTDHNLLVELNVYNAD